MKSKNNSNINGGFFFKGGKHQRGVPFQRRYPQNDIKLMVYIGNSYGQMDDDWGYPRDHDLGNLHGGPG